MKKTDFLKFIKSKHACAESQDWIKSLPIEDIDAPIWAKYLAEAQPDWAVWLVENIGGDISAEYERVVDTAWAEYLRVRNAARAEYKRVRDTALAEYERVVTPARAEYERVRDTARAEYDRVVTPARAEYERVMADAARKLLTFEAISKAVDNFMKM